MFRKLIIGSVIILAVACKKEQVNENNSLPQKDETTGTGVLPTSSVQRLMPQGGLKASASGPAATTGNENMNQRALAATPMLDFQPNAGVIWRDPATNQTHLLALRLPGPTGTNVRWQSLGTGWEGTELMAMDGLNYYVVWQDAVYRVPKRQPDQWFLFIPYNGEDIKGIMGTKSGGGFLARGNTLYAFSQSGVLSALYTRPGIIANTRLMSGFRNANGSHKLFFITYNGQLHVMSNETGSVQWSQPAHHNSNIYVRNMVGGYWMKKLYESREANGNQILEAEANGFQGVLGTYNYSAGAKLVINGGFLWIMGNTLLKIRTDNGIYHGVTVYAEYGWEGVLRACSDPELISNL